MSLEGMYRLVKGSVPGVRLGGTVQLSTNRDGTGILIAKPHVGVMASLPIGSTVHLSNGNLALRSPMDAIEIELEPYLTQAERQAMRQGLLYELPVYTLAAAGISGIQEAVDCLMLFRSDDVAILPYGVATDANPPSIPYAEVKSLRIGGRGILTRTTGGGFIGGGFGVEGFLEGAAMASLMNALTTRTKTSVETLIEIAAGPRALIALHDIEPPDNLRIHMAAVFDRLERAAPPAVASTASETRIALLKQLGELRSSGVLNDAEFEAEKARILGAP